MASGDSSAKIALITGISGQVSESLMPTIYSFYESIFMLGWIISHRAFIEQRL